MTDLTNKTAADTFLEAVSIAISGRSLPNCDLAEEVAARITDTAHRHAAEKVIELARDWIGQSYQIIDQSYQIGRTETELGRLRLFVDELQVALVAKDEEVQNWRKKLTAVMPADFKDWHENSSAEWPEVAAGVIKSLREREELAWKATEDARKEHRESLDRLRINLMRDALIDEERQSCIHHNPLISLHKIDAEIAKLTPAEPVPPPSGQDFNFEGVRWVPAPGQKQGDVIRAFQHLTEFFEGRCTMHPVTPPADAPARPSVEELRKALAELPAPGRAGYYVAQDLDNILLALRLLLENDIAARIDDGGK